VSAPGAGAEAAVSPAAPEGVPLTFDEALARLVDFDKAGGLVPAIVQDVADGTVLTVAYMDAEALRRTLETGRSWFFSRSRQEYWQKGETSGDRQYVREVRMVDQHGRGACHTGERTCFYRTIGTGPGVPAP
jgi:phosphoribosyl-AMP cyclohydrolase